MFVYTNGLKMSNISNSFTPYNSPVNGIEILFPKEKKQCKICKRSMVVAEYILKHYAETLNFCSSKCLKSHIFRSMKKARTDTDTTSSDTD